ncbi:hypothetical protein [Sphingobium sp. AS12]|uniref:hypothetical protein n=1 Tax=Sphingobium sp. AS12 TaxID=2849495 RepID=UPI0034A2B216
MNMLSDDRLAAPVIDVDVTDFLHAVAPELCECLSLGNERPHEFVGQVAQHNGLVDEVHPLHAPKRLSCRMVRHGHLRE